MQSQSLSTVYRMMAERGNEEMSGKMEARTKRRWINGLVNNLKVGYSAVKTHEVTEARTSFCILASEIVIVKYDLKIKIFLSYTT